MFLTSAARMLALPLPPGTCVISPHPSAGLSYEAAMQLTIDANVACQRDDSGHLTHKAFWASTTMGGQRLTLSLTAVPDDGVRGKPVFAPTLEEQRREAWNSYEW